MPLAARWRLLDSGPGDAAANMALDHALLERAAESGEAVFRIYAWERPTLSFGLHERTRLSAERVAAAGLDAVRRPTGGRALLHHREVTYSVTAPAVSASLRESYAIINDILLRGLHRLSVPVTIAERRGRARPPDGAPCFAEPNAGELVLGERKLVGSAQRRDASALLQHGSILLENDQSRIAALRDRPSGDTYVATLRETLGRAVDYHDVRDALSTALAEVVGARAVDTFDPSPLRQRVAELSAHYRNPEWTWRR